MKKTEWHIEQDALQAEAREKSAILCLDASLTQQHPSEDADINVIARRFGLDKGPIPYVPQDPAYYGDLSDVPDLRTALDLVNDANNKFMDLPAKTRARFDNLPGKLWAFVNDPDNAPEAVRLGLLKEPEKQQVPETQAPVKATPPTPVVGVT